MSITDQNDLQTSKVGSQRLFGDDKLGILETLR